MSKIRTQKDAQGDCLAGTDREIEALESVFRQLTDALMNQVQSEEVLVLQLIGEQSQFTRFNRAKVRQTGFVWDGMLKLTWMNGCQTCFRELPFTGDKGRDWEQLQNALSELRQEGPQLPADPYLVVPVGGGNSHRVTTGQLLSPDTVVSSVLPLVEDLDFAGHYAGGVMVRAYADSAGQFHWFATETFALDYSLFTPTGQAVKGVFAGNNWDQLAYAEKLQGAKSQFQRLKQTPRTIDKGEYRTYFAPAAVSDLVGMLNWGGVSEASLQRGGSALGSLQLGEKRLSPKFHLTETFQRGLVPQFNNLGEVAPTALPLIVEGELVNTLISTRTAKEYQKSSNQADSGESMRSPEVSIGALNAADIWDELGTGLYVSNLHYLNWSDRPNGRVTGMTRYACFWVEQGELVAPIENLRFDESLYQFFGENLIDLTDFQEFMPEVGTYGHRHLGGIWAPGMLVDGFTYTL